MPFMKDGKRDYKSELAWEKTSKPERVKHRAARNSARATLKAAGVDVAGKDVDHKKPLSKGGSNSKANLRAIAPSTNRSVKRNKDGSLR